LLNKLNSHLYSFVESEKSESIDEVYKLLSSMVKLLPDIKKLASDNTTGSTAFFDVNDALIRDEVAMKLFEQLNKRLMI